MFMALANITMLHSLEHPSHTDLVEVGSDPFVGAKNSRMTSNGSVIKFTKHRFLELTFVVKPNDPYTTITHP